MPLDDVKDHIYYQVLYQKSHLKGDIGHNISRR